MDRRWFGAIVVACTVLAAVVAPNVTARRVGGTAIPVAIDAPPAVGSCALTITDPWSSNPETGFAVGNVIDYPTARFGPCAGAAVGEVVFVDAATSPPEQVVDNDYQTILQQCALDAIGYLGSIPPVVYRGFGQPGIVWSSVLAFRYTAIGPSAVQRAAGQRWSACAVGSTEAKPYVGRLRNVLSTGVLPPEFGSCWPSVDLVPVEIPCDSPHAVELLGWSSIGSDSVSATELRQACTVYAGRALRTSDPTRDGAIRPEIVSFDRDTPTIPASDAVLADGSAACVLIAQNGRQFNNTLVGIGQRPLPLA